MAKRKRFNVSRRYEVWVDTEITAADFDDAVAQAKQMKLQDFVSATPGTTFNDWTELSGLGVTEQF